MTAIFLKLINISIMASWLVLAIVVLRLIFRNAPKYFRIMLWTLVGIRLICPFYLESTYSLLPSGETLPSSIEGSETPKINSGISFVDESVNTMISENMSFVAGEIDNPLPNILEICTYIWLVGMIAMVAYAGISYFCIRRKVREAVPNNENMGENIYLCDHIVSPFLFGMIRPCIYLPSDMNEEYKDYVIAHEKAHVRRGDNWWKVLGFLLLTVYWFHPMMWVAYILFCRDVEFACDEKVLLELGIGSRKLYSDALIACSMPRHMVRACPVSFGEVGVKGRIRAILKYKKPSFWIKICILLVCILVAGGFLTIPDKKDGNDDVSQNSQDDKYHILDVSISLEHENVGYRWVDGCWNKSKSRGSDLIENSYIAIEWTNYTDEILLYPMSYYISKDGEYIPLKENHGFYAGQAYIMPGETVIEKYYPSQFEITYSKSGLYCIEQQYQFVKKGEKNIGKPYYTAYIEFEVGE